MLYTKPSGLYPTCTWDPKHVRRLILRGELVPRYPGRDNASANAREECPICMLVYPVLNQTKCCSARLCTECYLQIRPPRHNKEACPFCKHRRVEAAFMGRRDDADFDREEADRLRALQAYKRLAESPTTCAPRAMGSDDGRADAADAADADDDALTRDTVSSHAGATVETMRSFSESTSHVHAPPPEHPPHDLPHHGVRDGRLYPDRARGDSALPGASTAPASLDQSLERAPIPVGLARDAVDVSLLARCASRPQYDGVATVETIPSVPETTSAAVASVDGRELVDISVIPPCPSCPQCIGVATVEAIPSVLETTSRIPAAAGSAERVDVSLLPPCASCVQCNGQSTKHARTDAPHAHLCARGDCPPMHMHVYPHSLLR